jgi:hypothetical protein
MPPDPLKGEFINYNYVLPPANNSPASWRGRGAKKKVTKPGNPSEYFKKTKMELPYELIVKPPPIIV